MILFFYISTIIIIIAVVYHDRCSIFGPPAAQRILRLLLDSWLTSDWSKVSGDPAKLMSLGQVLHGHPQCLLGDGHFSVNRHPIAGATERLIAVELDPTLQLLRVRATNS